MDILEANRAHIKPFLSFFEERVYSEKLRALARQVMKSRKRDIRAGQMDLFWDRDRIQFLSGVII